MSWLLRGIMESLSEELVDPLRTVIGLDFSSFSAFEGSFLARLLTIISKCLTHMAKMVNKKGGLN